jgi:hypothetical protein
VKKLLSFLLTLVLTFSLAACSVDTSAPITEDTTTVHTTKEKQTIVITTRPTTTTPEMTAKETSKATATKKAETTTKKAAAATQKSQSNDNDNKQTSVVYWVPNGEVYHLSQSCRTLSRSKTIRSGTIAQSGKPRACKVCG